MWKNFAMMLIIVSGTTLLFYKTSASRWLIKIAPYGKMSLTNYLGQSIIGAMLFYNWGFGFFRHFGHTASFFLGVAFIIVQFIFCTWWLKHNKRGPFEQLWYSATWLGGSKNSFYSTIWKYLSALIKDYVEINSVLRPNAFIKSRYICL